MGGAEVRRRTPSFLRELYFVAEEFHTPALTPRALVRLYCEFYPRFDHAAMERYLTDLEVDADRSMTAMSYGQKKKVLLAFAVASQCRLLILDEPTNGLDIPAKGQFRRLLAGAAAEDRVIVVSTHQVRDLEHLIDPIVILEQGEDRVSALGGGDLGRPGRTRCRRPGAAGQRPRHLRGARGRCQCRWRAYGACPGARRTRGADGRDGRRPGVAVQLGSCRPPARGGGVRVMMHRSNVFSVARAWYALRADLQQQRRAVLVGAGAAAALILAVNVTSANDAVGGGFHAAFFPLVLVVGGLLFTSTLFADLHDKPRAHAYLTLPISTLERWAVRLLLSTVGYAAVALAGYFVVTLLGAGVSQLIWGRSHAVFVPDADAWRTVLSYLVTSSLFLFGAVYFRRWHAIKVILGVAALWLALLR